MLMIDLLLSNPSAFGWVGLGAMGYPMALRLRSQLPPSARLYIYDIDTTVMERFLHNAKSEGVTTSCSNSREVAEKSEIIFTIVPEGAHVKSVYLDPQGLLSAPNLERTIFIDCSTIDISTSLHIAGCVAATGNGSTTPLFYDAPVSGGTAGATKGTLTFMLGASNDDPLLPLLKSLLLQMGTSVHPTGAKGLGLAAKLSNNYLSGMIALATSEAMNLGMRLGVDPKTLSACFASGSGGSWVNSTVNPVPGVCPDAVTSKGYEGGFKVQLMKKDMSLAINAAKEVDARLVLADAGLSAYSAAAEDPRCRDKDSRVVYRWLGGVEPDLNSDDSTPQV